MADINVIDPLGRVGSLPAEQVKDALGDGYKLASPEEVHSAKNEVQFGGVKGELTSAGLGALRGATASGSDVILTKSGLVKPSTIQGYQETNPVSSFAGEGAGMLAAPEALPGGLISKTGRAITGGLEALKGAQLASDASLAQKVLASAGKIGAQSAGSAVEGALYAGVGNSLNEYALGDPSLNGEKIMANFGYGALLGGAAGAALKSAEITIPPALLAAKDGLESLRNTLIGEGKGTPGALQQWLPNKISEAITNRQINLDSEGRAGIVKNVADDLNTVHNNIQTEIKNLNNDVRPQELEALIETADPKKSQVEQQNIVNAMNETVDKMKSRPAIYSPSAAAKLEDLRDEIVNNMGDGSPKNIFNQLRDAKQRLGKMVFTKLPTETTQDTLSAIRPISSMVNDTLKNPDVFGQAGAALASHDEMLSKYYNYISPNSRMTEFQKKFGSMTGSGAKSKWAIDPVKVDRVFKQTNLISKEKDIALLDGYYNTLKELPEHIENARASIPNDSWDKSTLSNIIDNSQNSTEEQYQKYLSSIQNKKNGLGLSDVMAGYVALHHPILGAAMEAYNVFRDPQALMNKLATVERIIGKTTAALGKGAQAIFVEGTKMATKVVAPIARTLSQHEDEHKKISNWANNPDSFIHDMSASTHKLADVAPDTTQNLHVTTSKAIQFLASKLPQVHSSPFTEDYKPSDLEMAQFDRYRSVVENPMLALAQVKNKTIVPETIESLNAVYPKLYDQMKQAVVEEASAQKAKDKPIPFQTKMAVSMFLGQPIDTLLLPQAVMNNQTPPPQQGPQANAKPSKAGMQKMTLAQRTGLGPSQDEAS